MLNFRQPPPSLITALQSINHPLAQPPLAQHGPLAQQGRLRPGAHAPAEGATPPAELSEDDSVIFLYAIAGPDPDELPAHFAKGRDHILDVAWEWAVQLTDDDLDDIDALSTLMATFTAAIDLANTAETIAHAG